VGLPAAGGLVKPPLPLPGTGCRYWVAGHCLHAESVNPGLDPHHTCLVLREWEGRFDSFVDLGEIFGISAADAGQAWERRMRQELDSGWNCPDFMLAEDDEMGCRYFLDGVCMLRLPVCPGRCRRFVLEREHVFKE